MRMLGLAVLAAVPGLLCAQAAPACTGARPEARFGHVMAFDAKLGEVVLVGGLVPDLPNPFPRATWSWNGTRWRCVTPSGPVGRIDAHLAWDAGRERLVLFGGRQLTRDRRSIFLRDTWEWDGSAWTRVDTAGPGPRVHGAMAYDPARRAIVLHGGGGADAMLNDTWEWREGRWREVAARAPEKSIGNALAVTGAGLTLMTARRDTSWSCVGRRRTMLLALRDGTFTPLAGDGPCFSPQAPAVGTGGGLLLFAGWNSPERDVDAETWQWQGTAWTKLPGGPPRRRGAAMAFDAARGRTVLFGGDGDDGILGDLWEHDGHQWTRVPE